MQKLIQGAVEDVGRFITLALAARGWNKCYREVLLKLIDKESCQSPGVAIGFAREAADVAQERSDECAEKTAERMVSFMKKIMPLSALLREAQSASDTEAQLKELLEVLKGDKG